jgi:ribonuclease Y
MDAVVILVTGLAGVVAGAWLAKRHSRLLVGRARSDAAQLTARAQGEVERIMSENRAVCDSTADRIRQAWAKDGRAIEDEAAKLEDQSLRREQRLEHRREHLSQLKAEALPRDEALVQSRQETRDLRHAAKSQRRAFRGGLEERAGKTADQVLEQLAEGLVYDVRSEAADYLRHLGEDGAAFVREAKRVMGITSTRYLGHNFRERTSSSVPLPRGIDQINESNPENLALLRSVPGVNLILSDAGDSLRIDTGDGVAKETCRRALQRFMGEKTIRDPERLLQAIRDELGREIVDTGKKAFRRLSLELASPEIVELVGKLNFRTSYTQNQWLHAIEASYLAGLMAAEMGLEPAFARRGALLHDIGKALTHELDGSHALIGAEIARRLGEDERVANAIGYHHGEEPLG